MLDDIKMYKKIILRGFLQLKRPEYLIYAPFETIYHTVYWVLRYGKKFDIFIFRLILIHVYFCFVFQPCSFPEERILFI